MVHHDPKPLLMKNHTLLQQDTWQSLTNHWNSDDAITVQVMYHNCLILIAIIVDDTFGENIEGLSYKYVICWAMDDMNLHINSKQSNKEWNITR